MEARLRRKGEISCFAVFPLVFTAEDYTWARDRGAEEGGDLLLMDYRHAYLASLNKYNTKNTYGPLAPFYLKVLWTLSIK
jgi:hypothetical protein